jgi:hypothetical protein
MERLQSWKFGDVARDTSSLVHGEHVGYVSISFAAIDVSDVGVSHFVAARNLLNGPWRREA